MDKFRFVDIFSGLGGFHLAASQLGGKCVFACEIDEQLRQCYQANFGILPAGDIRAVSPKDVPKHDLLCAGFPCQPFSKAGFQLGFEDSLRGTVFWNLFEIIKYHKPRFILLENVAHFVNHDKGNTYLKIRTALEKVGYTVEHRMLSPHLFGIPQIRERMYLVAVRSSSYKFSWPKISSDRQLSIQTILDKKPADARPLTPHVLSCLEVWQDFITRCPSKVQLPSFPIWAMEFGATYPHVESTPFSAPLSEMRELNGSFGVSLNERFRKNILSRVPKYAAGNDEVFPKWKQDFIKKNRDFYSDNKKWIDKWLPSIQPFAPSLQKFEWNCLHEDRDVWKYIIQFRASGVRVKQATTSPSLVAMTVTQVPIIAWEKRYMTVKECARLQSMDILKHFPQSLSSAFRSLGNAVNVTVAQQVLESCFVK